VSDEKTSAKLVREIGSHEAPIAFGFFCYGVPWIGPRERFVTFVTCWFTFEEFVVIVGAFAVLNRRIVLIERFSIIITNYVGTFC